MDRRNREVRLKMAIIPETEFPGKIIAGNANYPYGQARDITTPSDGTGTPWKASLVNDIFGFLQATLIEGGVTPSGAPDTATVSQYLAALKNIIDAKVDAEPMLGRGQTWQNVTGSRAKNTTYTNNTSKPIEVLITVNGGVSSSGNTLIVGGVTVSTFDVHSSMTAPFSFIVPVGQTYRINVSSTIAAWAELR